jgi:hypothetical protein
MHVSPDVAVQALIVNVLPGPVAMLWQFSAVRRRSQFVHDCIVATGVRNTYVAWLPVHRCLLRDLLQQAPDERMSDSLS